MKSGLIVQTSVGMRNVLVKKTLRSDAQPLSNRVATRTCLIGLDNGEEPMTRAHPEADLGSACPGPNCSPRSGAEFSGAAERPSPSRNRCQAHAAESTARAWPPPWPVESTVPCRFAHSLRGRPERVRPSTDGGRRQPGFSGQLSDARTERRPPRPDGCSPLPSRDLPAPASGRYPGQRCCRRTGTAPRRPAGRAAADVARDGLHSRTQCGSWGGSAGSSPPVISRLRHGQPPRGDPPGQGGPPRRTALTVDAAQQVRRRW